LSNLDANLRVQMRSTLLEIQRRVKITTVFVTHDQHEAMSISDKIIVMNRGRVEQVGTPLEIYQEPRSLSEYL
jgi:ABC-type sugar transport system ATPase subunit